VTPLLRLLAYGLLLALLVSGAVWFADHPGKLEVDWLAWRITTSVPVGLALLLLLSGLCFTALRLLSGFSRLPARWRAARLIKRRDQGYQALTDGLAAVAGGQVKQAQKMAVRAEKLLQNPAMTSLLSAQSAALNGDQEAQKAQFEALRQRPETALVGLRGLLDLAVSAAQDDVAVELLAEIRNKLPNDSAVAEQLFALLLRRGQLPEAQEILLDGARHKAFAKQRTTRLRALLLNERALRAERDGDGADALSFAKMAVSNDPSLSDAALRLARLQSTQDLTRHATATLEKAWKALPLPALARAYGELHPTEAPLQKLRRLERLAVIHPDRWATHYLLGEAALGAKLWGQARKYLTLAVRRPTASLLGLLARLEVGEYKNQQAAQAWLATAPMPEPDWRCGSCGHHAADWSLFCPSCGTLDSLRWDDVPLSIPPATQS
jgi:HemY protein